MNKHASMLDQDRQLGRPLHGQLDLKWRAERNFWMSMFAVTLVLVLYQYRRMMSRVDALEEARAKRCDRVGSMLCASMHWWEHMSWRLMLRLGGMQESRRGLGGPCPH